MNLVLFLTHNFNKEFLYTLLKLNNSDLTNYKIVVLFDKSSPHCQLTVPLKNIEIIKIDRFTTSYDNLAGGHTMYLNYFRNTKVDYEYVWIVENDVYYPNSFIEFFRAHEAYDHDLLVPQYGLRPPGWWCTDTLRGFRQKQNIGVYAFIMRLSKKLLQTLVSTIDKTHSGYLEAVLPHVCIEHGLSIQQFLLEMVGTVTTLYTPLLDIIKKEIQENSRMYLENKIYHPIKL